MYIDENTRISKLIEEKLEVIEAIVSISKLFEKLRIPILRKTLASRVTIKQAAKIGGVSVNDFYERLAPLGFIYNGKPEQGNVSEDKFSGCVSYQKLLFDKAIDLDVRSILKANKDPFNDIMNALATLPDNCALNIINTFEPIPLINILSKKGYAHETIIVDKMLVHTYFKKNNSVAPISKSFVTDTEELQASELLSNYKDKIIEIDVRALEMPLPMSTILNELHTLPTDYLLFVHHKKVPKFLFPELAERGYKWHIQEIKEGDVKLYIFK